jgi:hypothetical protein
MWSENVVCGHAATLGFAALETRLSRRLTCRASAEPQCFGIGSALKCEPVHALDAGGPTAIASMKQA